MKKQWISILIVGLTLGTAWAIRGQFGHEQGAAWAGGIGALAMVLVSKRRDWYAKAMLIAMSSAVGWGAGGMISYGIVVGYGRSVSFPNAAYGLLMLFVIGGLFGLLGGGLTGLTLESSDSKRVKWASLLAEMVAGGVIVYYLLVGQLGILMTPPRSEAWAICMGAGAAMLWHMARNNHNSALRVALYTALGGGFGFAFGNFLQVVGHVLEINFNMWNVMEYSIGFFGGISLAYSVFTSEWPAESSVPELWVKRASAAFVILFIPFVIFIESLSHSTLLEKFSSFPNTENAALAGTITGAIIILALILSGLYFAGRRNAIARTDVMSLFVIYLVSYILLSYVVSGVFSGITHLNHHLYWVNLIVIVILLRQQLPVFKEDTVKGTDLNKVLRIWAVLILVIIILALVLVNIHGEMSGAHDRFGVKL